MLFVIYQVAKFFVNLFGKALRFFSSLPGQLALVITAVGAVFAELSSFVTEILQYFSDDKSTVISICRQIGSALSDSDLYQLLSYMCALDLVTDIVVGFLTFGLMVFTFFFVTFLHLVLVYFGIRFGYRSYKFMLTVLSNGLAHG